MPKPTINRTTTKIDAAGQSIGRVASAVAMALQGKNRADYTPHIDAGDVIEVRNAAKVKITGKKLDNKIYYAYSGFPGGMKHNQLKFIMEKNPAKAIEHAVYSMLPKNRQRKDRMKRLTIKND